MTKDMWLRIANEDHRKLNTSVVGYIKSPALWPKVREAYLQFVADIDKATEVYNMENFGGKNDGK